MSRAAQGVTGAGGVEYGMAWWLARSMDRTAAHRADGAGRDVTGAGAGGVPDGRGWRRAWRDGRGWCQVWRGVMVGTSDGSDGCAPSGRRRV